MKQIKLKGKMTVTSTIAVEAKPTIQPSINGYFSCQQSMTKKVAMIDSPQNEPEKTIPCEYCEKECKEDPNNPGEFLCYFCIEFN